MPHQQQPPGSLPFISLSRAPNAPASRWEPPLPAGKRPPSRGRADRLPPPPPPHSHPPSPGKSEGQRATSAGAALAPDGRGPALRPDGVSVPPAPGRRPAGGRRWRRAALRLHPPYPRYLSRGYSGSSGPGEGVGGCPSVRARSVGLRVSPTPSGSQGFSCKWLITFSLGGLRGGRERRRKGKCWIGIDIPVIYFREKSFKMSSVISHKKSGYTG